MVENKYDICKVRKEQKEEEGATFKNDFISSIVVKYRASVVNFLFNCEYLGF